MQWGEHDRVVAGRGVLDERPTARRPSRTDITERVVQMKARDNHLEPTGLELLAGVDDVEVERARCQAGTGIRERKDVSTLILKRLLWIAEADSGAGATVDESARQVHRGV